MCLTQRNPRLLIATLRAKIWLTLHARAYTRAILVAKRKRQRATRGMVPEVSCANRAAGKRWACTTRLWPAWQPAPARPLCRQKCLTGSYWALRWSAIRCRRACGLIVHLVWSGADNTIYGEDGDDTVNGVGGLDALYGGKGDDELNAGAVASGVFTYGEEGDDTLRGNAGNDNLLGGPGDDWLSGGRDGTSCPAARATPLRALENLANIEAGLLIHRCDTWAVPPRIAAQSRPRECHGLCKIKDRATALQDDGSLAVTKCR